MRWLSQAKCGVVWRSRDRRWLLWPETKFGSYLGPHGSRPRSRHPTSHFLWFCGFQPKDHPVEWIRMKMELQPNCTDSVPRWAPFRAVSLRGIWAEKNAAVGPNPCSFGRARPNLAPAPWARHSGPGSWGPHTTPPPLGAIFHPPCHCTDSQGRIGFDCGKCDRGH